MTIIVQTTASNASRDYDWLQASIADWLHRKDLAGVIPDFVMLAEKRMNADLEGRLQDTVLEIMTTAGSKTAPIPHDVSELHSLSLPEYGALEYLTADQFYKRFPINAAGVPRYFAVIGSAIYLGPVPDDEYTLQCAYRAFVPPLSDSAGTNWLIEKYANVYLAACMVEALSYTKNFAELPAWEKKYADGIASVNRPDWFSGSQMRVRSDSQTV